MILDKTIAKTRSDGMGQTPQHKDPGGQVWCFRFLAIDVAGMFHGDGHLMP